MTISWLLVSGISLSWMFQVERGSNRLYWVGAVIMLPFLGAALWLIWGREGRLSLPAGTSTDDRQDPLP